MTRRTGMRPLRIAMIGQKGLPARYGGVETHVENIAVRLAARGHEVWAFCRSRLRGEGPGEDTYRGVHLAYRPSIATKHLDAASHTLLCAFEASALHGFDIIHLHGIGPSAFAPVAGLFGRRVVSTFHALDWRQVKWGARSKGFLRRGEAIGARRSDGLIAVSRLMQAHIQAAHGKNAAYIPNGAALPGAPPGTGALERWGLTAGGYILTVGRIIPDRELHTLIDAFNQSHRPLNLVVVGSETPRTDYSESLRRRAGDRVVFTGDVFGEALEELYAHCMVYCLASRVEGLPITVCEAMAHGRPLVLSDIPENIEVAGDAARYFPCGDVNALLQTLENLVADAQARVTLGETGRGRCEAIYNWDRVADQVESYYYQVASGGGT
ncbi:MAG TPA: glycosyltransferase family 4 protein [Candidatus Krumholzibacteria bacterium]|nr:glycosyltransferase family 4 protein [Candidatus Krumholzibacteria bacterium]